MTDGTGPLGLRSSSAPGTFERRRRPFSQRLFPMASSPAASDRPYNLLIATGKTPQVVTETVFEINRLEEREPPAVVHVATTRLGKAYGEAQLLGREREDPERGTPVEDAAPRWPIFCEEILKRPPGDDGSAPIDLEFHVPTVEGRGIDDIRRRGDDTRFANLCYRLVERLTREDQFPLVGSIAGGRKTMSAHLMTAFSVYGRPEDQLTHVLVSDASLEGDSSFFYPKPGDPDFGRLIDLVDVRFPRLRPLLSSDVIDDLPDDRRDLEGILDALEPQVAGTRDIETVRLELLDQSVRLVFEGPGGPVDTCGLTSKQASTLLVFAEARADAGEPVPNTTFANREEVEARRNAVRWICSEDSLKPWVDTDDVSKAFSELNDALGTVPVADRLLHVEGLSIAPRKYDWPGASPPLKVAARHAGEDWPFDHMPAPERL